ALIATPPTTVQSISTNSRDVTTRDFHDGDGNLIGVLNAEGYLARYVYDSAGRKIQDIAYDNPTSSGLRARGDFNDLLGSITPDATKDASARYVYDRQGLRRYAIDAQNHVTEYVYRDGADWYAIGRVRETKVYDGALGSLSDYSFAAVKSAVATLAG